jgi:hypothetical protein
MGFCEILWGSMGFYDDPMNRSVPTEANRGLTSYSMRVESNERKRVRENDGGGLYGKRRG